MGAKDIAKKYEEQLKAGFASRVVKDDSLSSFQYKTFLAEEELSAKTWFEKVAGFFGSTLKVEYSDKKMSDDISFANLSITPRDVLSFALGAPLIVGIVALLIIYILTQNIIMIFGGVTLCLGAVFVIMNMPAFYAQSYRMRASNQMILAIFYVVTYMRHTSNLERSIEFASHHLSNPLASDFKKIIWDVETRKYDSVVNSLEAYLVKWRGTNREFIDSFHLVVGSLYESQELKRQEMLSKSLDLILEETYDKMLHFAHNLQSPITALHMLGIVLPILGLIMLPLMVNFLPDVQWYYILFMYNIMLPIIIFIVGKQILNQRPSGYGGVEVNFDNPLIKSEIAKSSEFFGIPLPLGLMCIMITAVFVLIGLSPFYLQFLITDFGFGRDVGEDISVCGRMFCLLGYKESTLKESPNFGEQIGPYGLGSTILSLFIPGGIMLGAGLYYYAKSRRIMRIRNQTKELEAEFVGALFQLANRLGDGLPSEIAFAKVAQAMPATKSGAFFDLISRNIQKMGMGVEDAIFDSRHGAILSYPSSLIESSMKVLTQSSAKGPRIASNAIENVARYIREMNRVNERLQDLMAESIASMKSQIGFLTPIISGIVISITSMITFILGILSIQLNSISAANSSTAGNAGALSGFLSMFGDGVPSFYFSVIIGLYVLQVVYLLTDLVNNIQNGVDTVNGQYLLAMNLLKSVGLYLVVALVGIIVFNLIAGEVLGSLFDQ